jgi:hypothetical protein
MSKSIGVDSNHSIYELPKIASLFSRISLCLRVSVLRGLKKIATKVAPTDRD